MEGFALTRQWKTGAKADSPGRRMAESPIDDQNLLRELARGSETAFEVFYERYHGPIYRFALHMSGNPATAEEVTQEAFMVMIDNTKGYDPGKGTLAAWLFGVARNLTRRSLERTRLDLPLMEDLLEQDGQPGCVELDLPGILGRSELLETLRKAVLTLPEQYREVVVLCDLEEMTYPEAARMLSCSEGTVASRLHRARSLLKTKLHAAVRGERCAK